MFGRGAQHIQNLSEEQLDNRQFLIDFYLFNDYMIMNTMFPKPDYQKCTFKEVLTEGFKAPWSPDRFAQIDFILAPRAFKNIILDVTSRTDIAFNSDHSLISAKLRLKLRAGSIAPRQAAKRYHSPSDSQKQNYNDRIRAYFTLENDTPERLVNATNFILAMKKAAENTLPQKHKSQNQPYISEVIWRLIEDRQQARNKGNMAEEHRLNKNIAKQAKHDKQNWTVQKLGDLTDRRECWKNIRFEKSTFTPNFYSMKDISGNRIPNSQKADAIAEYLHCKQWGPKQNPVPANNQKPQILQDVQAKTGDLEYFEVVKAVKKLKTNKAPGPDGAVIELFKFLDQENVISLTECLNSLWRIKKVPDEFVQAHIASLYKKGNHENPENYRPILLLNTRSLPPSSSHVWWRDSNNTSAQPSLVFGRADQQWTHYSA